MLWHMLLFVQKANNIHLHLLSQAWQRHLNSSGMSDEDRKKTAEISFRKVRNANFSVPLNPLGIDQLGAKAVSSTS